MAKIHESQIFEFVQLKQEFSITWVAEDGKKITVDRAKLTSFFSSGRTLNIMCVNSGEIRTVNRLTIIEIDGTEVIK